MRIEQLQYLIEISNSTSISAASEKLHISYQALSHSMKSLENELDITLLTRTNKGSVLTEDGKKVVALAKQFIKGLDKVHAQKQVDTGQINGNINFVTTDLCLEYFLFDLMDYYKKNYPKVQFQYRIVHNQKEVFELMERDPTYFFLTFTGLDGYDTETPAYITEQSIASTTPKCVCSHVHELALFQSVSMHQLQKYDFLMQRSSGSADILPNNFRSVSIENSHILFEKKIQAGDHISIVYSIPFEPYFIPPINGVVKIDINTKADMRLALYHHQKFQQSLPVKLFLEMLYRKFNVHEPTIL